MDVDAIADHLPLLQSIPSHSREQFLALATPQTFAAQTVVIDQQDWAGSVWFVVQGWVRVSTQVANQEKTLDIFGQGGHLGTMAVFDDYPPLHQAITLTPTQVVSVSAQRFLQLLLKDPLFQHRLLQLTNQRIRHLYRRLKSTNQSPQRRVIKTLVYLAESYGKTTERGIEIVALSAKTLAEMVHCEPAIVHGILEQLVARGELEIVQDENYFYLPQLERLHRFSKQF